MGIVAAIRIVSGFQWTTYIFLSSFSSYKICKFGQILHTAFKWWYLKAKLEIQLMIHCCYPVTSYIALLITNSVPKTQSLLLQLLHNYCTRKCCVKLQNWIMVKIIAWNFVPGDLITIRNEMMKLMWCYLKMN